MLTAARIVFFVFAALLICGGIAGFVQAHSVMSLLAGILCGSMGLYAAMVLPARPRFGLALGLAGALLAAGGMVPRLRNKKTGEFVVWPAGTVTAFSAVAALVAAAGLVAEKNAGTR